MSERVSEQPNSRTGRFIVSGVAGIGALAILSFGVLQARERTESMDAVPSGSTSSSDGDDPELAAAVLEVHDAAEHLDLQAMERAEANLAGQLATVPTSRSRDARVALASSLADRALVAGILSDLQVPGDHGERRAATIAEARTRIELLPARDVERNLLESRLDLAGGADLIDQHPSILLPDFPDRELQAIALSRDLWTQDDLAVADASSIAEELAGLEDPDALVRGLQALAYLRADAIDRARELATALVQDTPDHPLAREILRRAGDDTPTLLAAAEGASPPPLQRDAPEPPRASKPVPASDAADPTRPGRPTATKPTTARDRRSSASTTRSKARSKPRPRAKPVSAAEPESSFERLVADGCKKSRSGEPEQALELLLKAFDLQPASTQVTLCMAQAHHRAGRDASARSLTDRILRSSPGNRRARLLAAQLEDARGNVAAAIAHYQKVLATDPDNRDAVAYLEHHGAR